MAGHVKHLVWLKAARLLVTIHIMYSLFYLLFILCKGRRSTTLVHSAIKSSLSLWVFSCNFTLNLYSVSSHKICVPLHQVVCTVYYILSTLICAVFGNVYCISVSFFAFSACYYFFTVQLQSILLYNRDKL